MINKFRNSMTFPLKIALILFQFKCNFFKHFFCYKIKTKFDNNSKDEFIKEED